MPFDYWLFDILNGFAGHSQLVDAFGRIIAIYGLLAVIICALGVCWWPRLRRDERLRYIQVLSLALVGCLFLYTAEWWLTTHVLHHELRARPFNARWVTLLITEESHYSFPAWPALLASAMSIPLYTVSKRWGIVSLTLACLTGLAMIFVGINYPFDVFTGLFVGSAVGYTARQLVHYSGKASALRLCMVWSGVLVWGIFIAYTVKPATAVAERSLQTPVTSSVMVAPPDAVMKALTSISKTEKVKLQAATNGHLLAASLKIIMPNHDVPLAMVQDQARSAANASFANWPSLQILTVEVAANFPHGNRTRIGTLYTATVTRNDWEVSHFARGHALPGKKFFHAQFYAHAKRS